MGYFCEKRNIDCFCAAPMLILDFLTEDFNAGASYGSLNSARSAIAAISEGVIGKDLAVQRFVKGVFKLRPSKPRYTHTWNPECVLIF